MYTSEHTAKIPHLRVCVTDVCDKKCFYCRPEGEGCAAVDKAHKLNTNGFVFLIGELVKAGISVVRFTGGEPMLNHDIYRMIHEVSEMPGVDEVSLVTRSLKLKTQAQLLKDAGLDAITISLDSLNPARLKAITKVDMLDSLIAGIRECDKVGIPIKLNTVVIKGVNDDEIEDFVSFAGTLQNAEWKLLDYMSIPKQFSINEYFLDLASLLPQIRQRSLQEWVSMQPGGLGIPMPSFKMKNGVKVSVKDSTFGNHYGDVCTGCPMYPCQDGIMALRLTADGQLQRCLYREDNLLDLRPFVGKVPTGDLQKVIHQALRTYTNAVFRKGAWKPFYDSNENNTLAKAHAY